MKILVSSCLLGEDVRYDGGNSSVVYNNSLKFYQKEKFMDFLCNNEIYSFCPEVSGGLPTPREPAEITSIEKPFKVQTKEGKDLTINFLLGAKNTLELCKNENIEVALLKSKSPSCGNEEIYNGKFDKTLIQGKGLASMLLEQNGIKVFNENQLEELYKYIKE